MLYQIAKSLVFSFVGAVPGILMHVEYINTAPDLARVGRLIAGVGALAGLGLSLPSSSPSRVTRLTIASLLAYYAPERWKTKIIESFMDKPIREYQQEAARLDYMKLEHINTISITNEAAQMLNQLRELEETADPLRVRVQSDEIDPERLIYDLQFVDEWHPERDRLSVSNGIALIIDTESARVAHGSVLDWMSEKQGFVFRRDTARAGHVKDEESQSDASAFGGKKFSLAQCIAASLLGLILFVSAVAILRVIIEGLR